MYELINRAGSPPPRELHAKSNWRLTRPRLSLVNDALTRSAGAVRRVVARPDETRQIDTVRPSAARNY